MKQIVVKSNRAVVEDAEEPSIEGRARRVLVKVHYSAVSAGTELGLIRNPSTPEGFRLGYSVSGEVMETGAEVTKVRKGDLVACYGGPYVHHAELLSVPEMLCVKVNSEERLREAALVGLGAIAVHSVRQLKLQFGEHVWVAGLGLLGLIIGQICHQANYRVFATDPQATRCALASELGLPSVYLPDSPELDRRIQEVTGGNGFDSIALCAHSSQPGLLDSCMKKLAFRGRFAIIGNVPVTVSRELFFQKEAELVIARAAGPGRYDSRYEDDGIDYPQPYVRWTEGRNMEEFIRQLEEKRLMIDRCITHEMPIELAEDLYSMLDANAASAIGVLFRYGAA